MATLNVGTFETGDVPLNEVLDALAEEWDYKAQIPNPAAPGETMPNPQTKAQFCKAQLRRILTEAYRNGKRKVLLREAERAVPNIDLT